MVYGLYKVKSFGMERQDDSYTPEIPRAINQLDCVRYFKHINTFQTAVLVLFHSILFGFS